MPAEDRANLEIRLKQHANSITDELVRRHFWDRFREQLWGNRRGRFSTPQTTETSVNVRASLSAAPSRDIHLQRKLVALLICHPWLFVEVEEQIGVMSFDEAKLESIRECLVEVLGDSELKDHNNLMTDLEVRGHGKVLSSVFNDPLFQGVKYLSLLKNFTYDEKKIFHEP